MTPKRSLTVMALGMLAAIELVKALEWVHASAWLAVVTQYLNDWSESPSASWLSHLVARGLPQLLQQGGVAYVVALVPAVLLTSAGFLARRYAQSRVRQGHADPLASLRDLRSRSAIARAVPWLPALAWALFIASTRGRWLVSSEWLWGGDVPHAWTFVASTALVTCVVGLALRAVAALGLRTLVSPVDPKSVPPAPIKDAADTAFRAAAVTRVTRGAVGAMALTSVGMAAWVSAASIADPRVFAAIAAYAAAAGVAALAFQRTARIVVGVDGVRVRDAFYAYRELDDVQAEGGDLVLVREGRHILRLQLHSEDADRRDELLARIRGALGRSKDESARAATILVNARPAADLARRATYREPTVSREQLWELVEGSTADASTRVAAAEALALALPSSERARLRVAAEQCAEPRARIALEALIDDDGDATPQARRMRRSPAGAAHESE